MGYSGPGGAVTIPEGVAIIDQKAFRGRTDLTSIFIPNSVTHIDDFAFEGCTNLTSVRFPASNLSTGLYAFSGCTSLASVTLENGITRIPEFKDCKKLTSITIPDTVTVLDMQTFSDCSGLTSVTIGNSVPRICSSTFWRCTGLTNVTIPNSVTAIDAYAFYNCTGLTDITIPSSVTEIWSTAFEGCKKLTIHGTEGSYAETFAKEQGISFVADAGQAVPSTPTAATGGFEIDSNGVLTKYTGAGGAVTIPNNVTSISGYAFQNCTGLTSVIIPNSITKIGYAAFDGCTGLTSISIPNSVIEIVGEAFTNCTGLTSVTIGDGVTAINDHTFARCTSLTNVNMGKNVTEIYMGAFYGCTSLTSITIPNGVTTIDLWTFLDCTSLTSVTIPSSVTLINLEAFGGCAGLTIYGVKGSYAETYAKENNIPFVAGVASSSDAVGGFGDVKGSDYFANPVLWAVEKGITAGTSATTFSPNQNCTVAQILTFLWRANGSPKPTGNNPFSDVKSGDYYADAATWAYEKGMVSGGIFGGNTPCTRSMAVTYMWKAAGSPSAKEAGFTDVLVGAEYAQAVAWAVEQGVTAGTSATTFSPDSVCTRGQIVTFLYRGLAK